MSDLTKRLYCICAETVGMPADEFMQSREWRTKVSAHLFAIGVVARNYSWPDAKQSADALSRVARKVRELRAEIEALDGMSWSYLTGAADPDVPPGCGYDPLAPLAELEMAVEGVASRAAGAAAWRPNGGAAGRAPNRGAYAVAYHAAELYHRLTGEAPGFYTGDPTPYDRMLGAFFQEFDIKADTQRPALWAIAELKRKKGN